MDNSKRQYDKIIIRDIIASCIIGILDEEKKTKQELKIGITLFANLTEACISDCLEKTINYEVLSLNIIDSVNKSSFNLIEASAQHIAQICLKNPQIHAVKVTVEKTRKFAFASGVFVEIFRKRD